MVKHTYSLDLKIYEPANMYEVPWPMPESVLTMDGLLKLGYHTIVIFFSQQDFEEFSEWCGSHGNILKIVGSERLD